MRHSAQPPAKANNPFLGWIYAFSAAVVSVVCSLPLAWVVSDGDHESGLERFAGFVLCIPPIVLGLGVFIAVMYFKLLRTVQVRKRAIWGMWLLSICMGCWIYSVAMPHY